MSFLHPDLPPHQVSSLMPNTMDTFQPTFYLTPQLQLAQIINFSFKNILFSWIPWPSYSPGFPPISLISLSISYFHFSCSTSSLSIRVAQNLSCGHCSYPVFNIIMHSCGLIPSIRNWESDFCPWTRSLFWTPYLYIQLLWWHLCDILQVEEIAWFDQDQILSFAKVEFKCLCNIQGRCSMYLKLRREIWTDEVTEIFNIQTVVETKSVSEITEGNAWSEKRIPETIKP